MRVFLVFIFTVSFVFAQDCELFFEARKAQMAVQIQEYDDARQNLEAFKASFLALQKQKEKALKQKLLDINATLAQVQKEKKANEEVLAKTKQYLEVINQKTTGKVTEIYGQMKPKIVAAILSQMSEDEATKMLLSLKPRAIAGIISKMEPKKAAQLTLLLKKLDIDKKKLKSKNNK